MNQRLPLLSVVIAVLAYLLIDGIARIERVHADTPHYLVVDMPTPPTRQALQKLLDEKLGTRRNSERSCRHDE
jgi:hypothetical protein